MLTTSLGLTKGGVKWELSAEAQSALDSLERDNSVADLLKKAKITREEIQRFQNENPPDAIKIDRVVNHLGDILKKIDGKNTKDRQAVLALLETAISSAPENSDSKT